MSKAQHAASIRSAESLGDELLRLFRLIGTADAPRGRLLSAYRRARDVLGNPDALQNARAVRETLDELQRSVERDLGGLWDDAAGAGAQRAAQQKAIYGAGTRREGDRDRGEAIRADIRDAAVGAVTAIVARQAASIVADVLQGRATPERVVGDGASAGVLNPFQALGPARDQVAQAGRIGYAEELGLAPRTNEWWKQAVAAIDDRTTECCLSVHGQTVPVGDLFTLDSDPRYEDEMESPPFHWNAVLAGEKVATEKTAKLIENVKIGDKVLTHKGRMQVVTAALTRKHDGLAMTILTSGGTIHVTPEHPVLTTEGWMLAGALRSGWTIIGRDDGRHTVKKVTARSVKSVDVYDLSVDGDESYCINGHFVHNCRTAMALVHADDIGDSLTDALRDAAGREHVARDTGGGSPRFTNALRE